jgi:hypothetical protein
MSEPYTQTITCCAAGRGWLWWVEAFRLVKEAVGPWFLIGLGYLSIMMLLLVPYSTITKTYNWMGFLTGALPGIVAPCFIVGFVAAAWTQARGETPQFSHLFSGFKADVKTLLGIGATTTVLLMLFAKIFMALLGEDFAMALINIDKENSMELLALFLSPRLWLAMLVYVTLITLVWMAGWLAPMVVVFQRAGIVGALWSSLKALLLNWRALAVFALVPIVASFILWIALIIVLVVLALLFMGGGGGGGAALILSLIMALLLPIMPLFVSLGTLTAFVAYCDIFHARDAVFPRPPKVTAL